VDLDVIVICVVEWDTERHQHQLRGDNCELNNLVANLFNEVGCSSEEVPNSLLKQNINPLACVPKCLCSAACQRSHWSHHKSECKSPLGKETWQPAWALESRKPAFTGDDIGKHFGATKYLWGNIPAYDVLQLESNEGKSYARDLRILFAGVCPAYLNTFASPALCLPKTDISFQKHQEIFEILS
jgi:hypothetical protein